MYIGELVGRPVEGLYLTLKRRTHKKVRAMSKLNKNRMPTAKENWCIKEEDWVKIKADSPNRGDLFEMVEAGEVVLIADDDGSIIGTLGIDGNGNLKEIEIN